MSHTMRTRTTYCPHGFLVPGLPEPWQLPRSKGGAELKASRFCLKCWEQHGQVFLAHGYTRILTDDPCQYGFLNLIHFVLKDGAWYRDQDRYEFLETELRLHLLEKRALIENAIQKTPEKIDAYVRVALRNKLVDLQRDDRSEHQIETNSISDECAIDGVENAEKDFDSSDENERDAAIMDVVESVSERENAIEDARDKAAKGIIDAEFGGVRFNKQGIAILTMPDPKDPILRFRKKSKKQENAELVRAAFEEQGHRIDALASITQEEQRCEMNKAHRQLLKAVDELPHDEQSVIQMRFLDGQELREGKPRARRDILRELRINGNGASGWTEWDLRRLEQQAVIRLRQKVKLPSVFSMRD